MDAPTMTNGRGVMYPATSTKIFFLLCFLWAGFLTARTEVPPPGVYNCAAELAAPACQSATLATTNYLAELPGYSGATITAQLSGSREAVEVTVTGGDQLPEGTLGMVILSEEEGTQAFRIVSDGWTIMVIADDL